MQFNPGFRLSIIDVSFVIVVTMMAMLLYMQAQYFLMVVVLTPSLQFFLFCNVFRIRRLLELIWASLYLIIFTATFYIELNPIVSTTIMVVIGLIFIGLEMRQPDYHGIFWQRINPKLPRWFEQHGKSI